MKARLFTIGLLLSALVACTSKVKVPEPAVAEHGRSVETPTSELAAIDSLMWEKPNSALTVLLEYLSCRDAMIASSNDAMDTMRRIQCVSTNETFDNHYAQLLASELLFKNDYAQTNRTELLQAVEYFDSLMQVPEPVEGPSDRIAFLDARAHYINGAGYYEQGDLVSACTEYLNTLRIMESHFGENEMVGHKARFMALTYGRLLVLFKDQFMPEPAIYCGKQYLVYNQIAPTSLNAKANILYNIGLEYHILDETDSVVFYYEAAFNALHDRNTIVYRDLMTSQALFDYYDLHDTIKALDSLKIIPTLHVATWIIAVSIC